LPAKKTRKSAAVSRFSTTDEEKITLFAPVAHEERKPAQDNAACVWNTRKKEPSMIHLDTLSTLVAATLVLLLGRKLVHSVSLLKKYTIPEPVAGGLLVALALLVLKKAWAGKSILICP
jgi:ESS family glutamate:Na+ symporter